MKNRKSIFIPLVLVALVLLALNVRVGYAEPSVAPKIAAYEITWYTIDGGGAMFATGGSYELSGTIGQYDAGLQSGGTYNLNGGFWGFLDSLSKLYLPLIMK